ncbi:MAG: hypothetical protein R2729_20485 [Bryobacteraceae bacterium]
MRPGVRQPRALSRHGRSAPRGRAGQSAPHDGFRTDCGADLEGDPVLVCGACRYLVVSAELKALQESAIEARRRGDVSEELRLWRQSLDMLPAGTAQRAAIGKRVDCR